jgi:hypothetical protein
MWRRLWRWRSGEEQQWLLLVLGAFVAGLLSALASRW